MEHMQQRVLCGRLRMEEMACRKSCASDRGGMGCDGGQSYGCHHHLLRTEGAAGELSSEYMYAVLVCIMCVCTYIHVHENRVEQRVL